ncbi:MAG: putative cupredoxin-like copper-binding protein [Paracoccaceae bacterium]|jgi:uncharacterized cupredoxin-like copper-binding protein
MINTPLSRALGAAAVALILSSPAFAAGAHSGGHGGGAATGAPGKASAVTRTIEVVMHDTYYEPESIEVKPGETIRFKIRNAGEFVHEFNIGTADMHLAHQPEMQMMVDMNVLLPDRIDLAAGKAMQASMGHGMHDEPNSALLAPGKSAEMIWTFPKQAGAAIEFGCNVPGHYGSGMVGDFLMDQ